MLIAAFGIRARPTSSTPYYKAINDAGTYNRLGSMIAQTGDYDTGSAPGSGAGGSRGPTAYFPPGFPYFLAAVDIIDGHQAGGKTALKPERIAQAVLGTVDGRAAGAGGARGVRAAGRWSRWRWPRSIRCSIELSGTLVAENLLIVLELAAVWTALRARRARGAPVLAGSPPPACSPGWPR